jgi:hypothetical protein
MEQQEEVRNLRAQLEALQRQYRETGQKAEAMEKEIEGYEKAERGDDGEGEGPGDNIVDRLLRTDRGRAVREAVPVIDRNRPLMQRISLKGDILEAVKEGSGRGFRAAVPAESLSRLVN